jgi:hypothetical protein
VNARDSTRWHATTWARVTSGGWTLLVEYATHFTGWLWRLRDPVGHSRKSGIEKSAELAKSHADAAAIAEGAGT